MHGLSIYPPFSHKPYGILFTPQILRNPIVSHFSWVLQSSQEKSKTMVMQNLGGAGGRGGGGGGGNKVHYGHCENGEFFYIYIFILFY